MPNTHVPYVIILDAHPSLRYIGEKEAESMDFRALQYFLAVAEEENISHAAEALHVNQPTLSRQMMDLEADVGKVLFIRGKRRLTLTDEGLLLRKRAAEILDLVDKTQSELRDLSDHVAGDVFIDSGETDALRLLARSAKAVQHRYSGVRFHISSGDGADVAYIVRIFCSPQSFLWTGLLRRLRQAPNPSSDQHHEKAGLQLQVFYLRQARQ